jgi:hypothetical protein
MSWYWLPFSPLPFNKVLFKDKDEGPYIYIHDYLSRNPHFHSVRRRPTQAPLTERLSGRGTYDANSQHHEDYVGIKIFPFQQ